jgi:hypothetical protein
MSIEQPPSSKGKPKKEKPSKKQPIRKVKGAPEVAPTENVVKIFKPTLPSVNMRPSYISLQYQKIDLFKKMIFAMIGVVLLFFGVAGGNIVLTFLQENQNARMIEEIEALKERSGDVEPYKVYIDGIENMRTNMSRMMSQDLDMGIILSAITEAAQANNVTITALKVNETLSGVEPDSCSNPDPFSENPKVGCIIVAGAAGSRDDVLSFFDSLESNEGIEGGFISEIGSAGAAITFKGTVSVQSNLFSKRASFLIEAIGDILRNGGLKETESFVSYSPSTGTSLDPQFVSCTEANAAGYGPYTVGVDPEYQWYTKEDAENTGTVCTPPVTEEVADVETELDTNNADDTLSGNTNTSDGTVSTG